MATYTYPGVYIQELPSPVHTIAGVATSIAAFVGYTPRGIDGRAEVVFSASDFQRQFGGLSSDSELSYAVAQFFQNGGTQAYVVRVGKHGAGFAAVTFEGITLTALSSGTWADFQLLVDIDVQNLNLSADKFAFNVTITDLVDQTTEYFPSVTLDPTAMNFAATVLNDPDNGSQLIRASMPTTTPTEPLTLTGLVGAAVDLTAVTTALGTTTAKDFDLVLTTTQPAPAAPFPLTVAAFPKGTVVAQSVTGLAAQLQQAISAALTPQLSGASVQCSVSPVGATGQAIRINALLPNNPDAEFAIDSFTATATAEDAATPLGLTAAAGATPNAAHYALGTLHTYGLQTASPQGSDGSGLPTTSDLQAALPSLQKIPFNLLSIPDAARALPSDQSALDPAVDPAAIYGTAITLCDQVRAFLLVDPPPNVTTVSGAIDWISSTLGITDPNGAAFWPRLRLPDPLNNSNLRTFAPSGVIAGVYARSDGASGVWTAPAGIQATLSGAQSMTYRLSDQENGQLNPLALNCLRTFPVYGSVVWGSRTLAGADALASQWKYVPVRRMALFLESSLYQGTQWVVFQPNDEPLWAAIRLNISSFMQTYFLKGAFQGQTPDEAYFVKCDSETTTQADIDNGVVNILVGFAPLEPAEFVVIQIEQLTGQAQS
jgi:hypothetical protein